MLTNVCIASMTSSQGLYTQVAGTTASAMGMQCEQPTERLLFKHKPHPLVVIKAVKVHANEASPQVRAVQVLFLQTSFLERS